MRIPLKFIWNAEKSEFVDIQAITTGRIEKLRTGYFSLTFAIDTGSSKSFISYEDSRRIKLIPESLPHVEYANLAGGRISLRETPPLSLFFRNDKMEVTRIKLDSFLVAMPANSNQKNISNVLGCPSILGLDFLCKTKSSLYVNPSSNITYIELV